MSRVSGVGIPGWGGGSHVRSIAAPGESLRSRASVQPAPASDTFVGRYSRSDLLAMDAGIDETSRTTNALHTAHDAIGVIGGLLENVQSVLKAAGSGGGTSFDRPAEQSRIDSAVTTIDAIASSSRFRGRKLLDGTFTASSATGAVAIPSFVSSVLGSGAAGGAALFSMTSGNANDLGSGNLDGAKQIVTTALSDVGQTQLQIDRFITLGRDSSGGQTVSADPASDMLDDTSIARAATANSPADRVLALLA